MIATAPLSTFPTPAPQDPKPAASNRTSIPWQIVALSALGVACLLAAAVLLFGMIFSGCTLPVKASVDADAERFAVVEPILAELERHLPAEDAARTHRLRDAWAVDLKRSGAQVPDPLALPATYRAAFAPTSSAGVPGG